MQAVAVVAAMTMLMLVLMETMSVEAVLRYLSSCSPFAPLPEYCLHIRPIYTRILQTDIKTDINSCCCNLVGNVPQQKLPLFLEGTDDWALIDPGQICTEIPGFNDNHKAETQNKYIFLPLHH